MKNILIIILIFSSGFLNQSFGQRITQCDSIKIYNDDFDNLFQSEFESIKADEVLAIRHCASTNGCNYTFGLLCWKVNEKYNYKLIRRGNKKIKTRTKIKRKLKNHLISFFDKKVFSKTGKVETKQLYIIDDGPYTTILFKSAENCWRFGYDIMISPDIRVVWTRRLIELIRE